jgi:uncharacterized protein (TIGR00661 family)
MKIYYGVNGEGLGHASRTLAIAEQLPDCQVHIFTYGAAYHFLQSLRYPFLHAIEGLLFSYRHQRVNYTRSLAGAGWFCWAGLRRNIAAIRKLADRDPPDLFVSDFEPSIARAARTCGGRLVSVDNQHRFVHCPLHDLPAPLRFYARIAAWATRLMVPHPDHTVISTFHEPHACSNSPRITLTAGLLRRLVEQTTVDNLGFLLVYVRSSVREQVLHALADIDREVRVYGAAESPQRERLERTGRFRFCALSPEFVQDLAHCDRLLGTAGNQLICEARYFRKPMLAIPEPGQYEQHINAWYVQRFGLGRQCHAGQLTAGTIREFLGETRTKLPSVANGVRHVVQVIRQQC